MFMLKWVVFGRKAASRRSLRVSSSFLAARSELSGASERADRARHVILRRGRLLWAIPIRQNELNRPLHPILRTLFTTTRLVAQEKC